MKCLQYAMCALALIFITGGFVYAEEFAISAMDPSEDELAINSFSTSDRGMETVQLSAAAALLSSNLAPDDFAMASAFTIESVQASGNIGTYGGQETQISYSAINVFPKISDRYIVWEEWTNGRSDVRTYSLDMVPMLSLLPSNYPRAAPDTAGDYLVYEQAGSASSSSRNTNVMVYDSIAQTEKAIAQFAANQHKPAVSGNYAVWHDWRSGVPNIYFSDLTTGVVNAISPSHTDQFHPAISGTRIVWEDWRNGNADIYMYDIATGIERQLTSGKGNEIKPKISGNIIVWQDDREISSSIYALTLDNMVEARISFEEGSQVNPDISGGLVVWEHRVNSRGSIHMLDLMQSRMYRITDPQHDSKNPSIYGTNIVWEDYRSGSPNIYMFQATGLESPLSSYRLYGTVQFDGTEAPPGTIVEAVIDGSVRGSFTVIASGLLGNAYGPYLEIPIFRHDYGKTIQFYVNQYLAAQTIPVATPGMSQISLNAINTGNPPVGTYTLQGTLFIDGQPAPQGTVLTAYVGSRQRATTTVFGNGQYHSFVVPVYQPDMGNTITFSAVYGQQISQSMSQIRIGERINLPFDISGTSSSSLQTPIFSGNVMIDGRAAPGGSVLTAFVGDVVRAQTTLSSAGQYNNLAVPVTQSDIGKLITFYLTSNTMSYQAAQSVTVGSIHSGTSGTSSGTVGSSDPIFTLSIEENDTVVTLEQRNSSDEEFSAESLTLIDPSHSVQTPSYVRLDLTFSTKSDGGTGGTTNAYLFSGSAQLDGTMLPAGTIISAYVNNELRGTIALQTSGQYTNLRVPITSSDYGRNIQFTVVHQGQSYQALQQITVGSGGSISGTVQDGSLIGLSVEGEQSVLSVSSDLAALAFDPSTVNTRLDLTFSTGTIGTGGNAYSFSGSALLDGITLPAGTIISAYVHNELRGTVALQAPGQYTNLRVPLTSADYGHIIQFTAVLGGQSYQASQQVTIGSGGSISGTGQDGSLIALSVNEGSGELTALNLNSMDATYVQTRLDLTFSRSGGGTSGIGHSYTFSGFAQLDGTMLAAGTVISAYVNNELRGTAITQTLGQYTNLRVPLTSSDYGRNIQFTTVVGGQSYQASQQITIGSGGSISNTGQDDSIIALSMEENSANIAALSLDPTSTPVKLDLSFARSRQQAGSYTFYGAATIDGTPVPIGTQITAKVGKEVRKQVSIQTAGSYQSIDVPIYSDDYGKQISFYATYGVTTYESTQFATIDAITTTTKQMDLNFISLASSTYRFYGTARIDGQSVPAQTTIYATVDGEVRGSYTTIERGQYGSASGLKLEVQVYRSDIGKYIYFKTASGAEATQSQLISGGLTLRKDLTFRTTPVQSAAFDATPVSGISPLTVSFRDRTLSAPNEWYWEFGDGGTSTERNPTHTYREAGSYTVRLTVGHPNAPVRQEVKYNYINVQKGSDAEALISLSPGWNFISTPKTLAVNFDTAERLFGSIPVAGHSVFSFNHRTNQWTPLSANSVFKPFEPVWIYSEYPANIQLFFEPDAMQIPPLKQLTHGWNIFGITSLSRMPAHNALLSVKDDWVYVIGFNAATQRYEQTIMNLPESYNTMLVPGKGYWLYMSADGELAGLGV